MKLVKRDGGRQDVGRYRDALSKKSGCYAKSILLQAVIPHYCHRHLHAHQKFRVNPSDLSDRAWPSHSCATSTKEIFGRGLKKSRKCARYVNL